MIKTNRHRRFVDEQLRDTEFQAEYRRVREQIAQVDAVVAELDRLRIEARCSKAELARRIGKNPAAIRRLFTAQVNPELQTVAALAAALHAKLRIVHDESQTTNKRSTAA